MLFTESLFLETPLLAFQHCILNIGYLQGFVSQRESDLVVIYPGFAAGERVLPIHVMLNMHWQGNHTPWSSQLSGTLKIGRTPLNGDQRAAPNA